MTDIQTDYFTPAAHARGVNIYQMWLFFQAFSGYRSAYMSFDTVWAGQAIGITEPPLTTLSTV